MPTAIDVKEGATFNRQPGHVVQIKEFWFADWVDEPYLFANSLSKRCYPGVGSAELEYEYGFIKREDQDAPELYPRLELLHWFVRIQVNQYDDQGNLTNEPIVWIGF